MLKNVSVQVKVTIDFRRSSKVFIWVSGGWISWIISEGFTEASGLLSSFVCNFCLSGSVVLPWCAHCRISLPLLILKLHRHTLLCPYLNSGGAAWTGQAKVALKDRPVMWLMAKLNLQPCKGSRRENLSSPLCQQQASQSALPHWPLSQLRAGNEIFGNQTIRLPLVFCFLSSVWKWRTDLLISAEWSTQCSAPVAPASNCKNLHSLGQSYYTVWLFFIIFIALQIFFKIKKNN